MYRLTKDLDYLAGHLRYGHKELLLTDEEYKKYMAMSKEERMEYFQDECEIVVDDFEVDDYEDSDDGLDSISVEKV
jgi:hypothetical protein